MKKGWILKSGEEKHVVIYIRNIFGFARVEIDGDEFPLGHTGCLKSRNEPFRVGDFPSMLVLKGRKARVVCDECEVNRIPRKILKKKKGMLRAEAPNGAKTE